MHAVSKNPIRELLQEHGAAVLAAADVAAVVGGFTGILYGFVPAYLVHSLHYSPSDTALALTTALLVSSAGVIVVGWAGDHLPRHIILRVGTALLIVTVISIWSLITGRRRELVLLPGCSWVGFSDLQRHLAEHHRDLVSDDGFLPFMRVIAKLDVSELNWAENSDGGAGPLDCARCRTELIARARNAMPKIANGSRTLRSLPGGRASEYLPSAYSAAPATLPVGLDNTPADSNKPLWPPGKVDLRIRTRWRFYRGGRRGAAI